MSRPPVIQYWDAEPPPDYIARLFATVRQHNPGLRHLVFSEPAAESFIGEHFSGREVNAFRACAVPAMQSDYLRYCAVIALGGVYVDADFECIADLGPLIEPGSGGTLFYHVDKHVINGWRVHGVRNDFLAFDTPGHSFLSLVLEIATANIEHRIAENVWLTTGPGVLSALIWLHRLGSFDAFLQATADAGDNAMRDRRLPELLCEVIGDYDRVPGALDTVRLVPFAESRAWIRDPKLELPYRSTGVHWVQWQDDSKRSIFR